MKLLLTLLFSMAPALALGASCCVSNTSVPNLIILPSKWQQTFMAGLTHVIGDVNPKGKTVFRNQSHNKERTQFLREDLSYSWSFRYQTGISMRYQDKMRDLNGSKETNVGWSDIGLSHAYMPAFSDRLWFYQTFNIPTSNSVYNSQSSLGQGTGTYLTSVGFFKIDNYKEGDLTFGGEVHRSFPRKFNNNEMDLDVRGAWGGSLSVGAGYVPWKSKSRLGINITPRLEGPKAVVNGSTRTTSKQSVVWDTVLNYTYSFDAQYAIGLTYLDQTILGPARNTLLNRTYGFIFQSRYE